MFGVYFIVGDAAEIQFGSWEFPSPDVNQYSDCSQTSIRLGYEPFTYNSFYLSIPVSSTVLPWASYQVLLIKETFLFPQDWDWWKTWNINLHCGVKGDRTNRTWHFLGPIRVTMAMMFFASHVVFWHPCADTSNQSFTVK